MNHRITNRRKFMAYAAVTVMVLIALRIPAAQRVVIGGLVEFAEVTERIVRLPSWISDHKDCFSLDRFDPTCPQCM
jgi:hypothetical protein